eukprot:SAG31_NODE_1089_length_9972_cov_4.602856_8_plen_208_part_00
MVSERIDQLRRLTTCVDCCSRVSVNLGSSCDLYIYLPGEGEGHAVSGLSFTCLASMYAEYLKCFSCRDFDQRNAEQMSVRSSQSNFGAAKTGYSAAQNFGGDANPSGLKQPPAMNMRRTNTPPRGGSGRVTQGGSGRVTQGGSGRVTQGGSGRVTQGGGSQPMMQGGGQGRGRGRGGKGAMRPQSPGRPGPMRPQSPGRPVASGPRV